MNWRNIVARWLVDRKNEPTHFASHFASHFSHVASHFSHFASHSSHYGPIRPDRTQ
jgi:hypothetical protein